MMRLIRTMQYAILSLGCFSLCANAQDIASVCTTVDVVDVGDSIGSDMEPAELASAISVLLSSNITPFGTAYLKNRWRLSDSAEPGNIIVLNIAYLNGTSQDHATVKRYASEWLTKGLKDKIAFRFDQPKEKSQIRILFGSGSNNSAVGRRALFISDKSKPTMNLTVLSPRVVRHEFGHALGLEHEHLNPDSPFVWNEAAVIADLSSSQGWTPDYIKKNVINKLDSSAQCVGDPSFNRESIMEYAVPASWTKNNVSTSAPQEISKRDFKCVGSLYGAIE